MNKMNKKIVFLSLSLLILVMLVGNVLAITAKIGNARMILRPEVGDEIEKSIQVINDNDVIVDINLFASGDLEDDIEIIDTEFRLEPGEEKKAFFKIEIKEPGKTETQINVQFTPVDGKNGAGLSSTVIIIASGEGELDEDDEEEDEDSTTGTTGKSISDLKLGKTGIALIITSIVFVIFLVLLIIYSNQAKQRAEQAIQSKKQTKEIDQKTKRSKTKPKKRAKKNA